MTLKEKIHRLEIVQTHYLNQVFWRLLVNLFYQKSNDEARVMFPQCGL